MREYLDRFVTWAQAEHSVRGVIVLGSAAQGDPIDPLADLDLMVITTHRRRLAALGWLDSIDPAPLFAWTYQSPVGGERVRQAIYEGPLVVDLALVPRFQSFLLGVVMTAVARFPRLRGRLPATFSEQLDAWVAITTRGTKILVDKDGLAKRMTTAPGAQLTLNTPTQEVYLNTVHSFFGLVLWESKQLARHELWMALVTVDRQVRQCLLRMIEWHSIATTPGLEDTWYGGRRITEWADRNWSTALHRTWPTYDDEAAWQAMLATLELFSAVAKETAHALGYAYPQDTELRVREWMNARRSTS